MDADGHSNIEKKKKTQEKKKVYSSADVPFLNIMQKVSCEEATVDILVEKVSF